MEIEKTIFSKIIDREIPANIVYEDDMVIAFLDINPVTPGHTLVVPKKVFVNIFDGDSDYLSQMMVVASKIGQALKQAKLAEGVNLMMSNETIAGQEIPHAHLHIIPRFAGDGVDFSQSHQTYTDSEANEVSKKIISHLDN